MSKYDTSKCDLNIRENDVLDFSKLTSNLLESGRGVHKLSFELKRISPEDIRILCGALNDKNSTIQVIRFERCGFDSGTMSELGHALADPLCKVTKLEIKEGIEDIPFRPLFEILRRRATNLRSLVLQNVLMSTDSVNTLADYLTRRNCHLHELDLSEIYLENDKYEILLNSLIESPPPELKSLNLSHTRLPSEVIPLLCQFITSPSCCLKHLSLSRNPFPKDVIRDLLSSFSTSKRALETFDLDESWSGEADVSDVLPLLEVLKKPSCRLQKLNLRKSHINNSRHPASELVRKLLEALVDTRANIEEIDLSGWYLEDEGVRWLIEILRLPNSVVRHLKLNSCGISDEGLEMLSNTLPECKVTHLQLSRNLFSTAGCEALGRSLIHPRTCVVNLDLSDNKNVTSESYQKLCEILQNRTSKIVYMNFYSKHAPPNAQTLESLKTLAKSSRHVSVLTNVRFRNTYEIQGIRDLKALFIDKKLSKATRLLTSLGCEDDTVIIDPIYSDLKFESLICTRLLKFAIERLKRNFSLESIEIDTDTMSLLEQYQFYVNICMQNINQKELINDTDRWNSLKSDNDASRMLTLTSPDRSDARVKSAQEEDVDNDENKELKVVQKAS